MVRSHSMRNWNYYLIAIGIIVIVCNSCRLPDKKPISSLKENGVRSKQSDITTNCIEWYNDSTGFFLDSRDGKHYRIVRIQTQIWFAENLAYHPEEGDFWSVEDNPDYISEYGYLYFWETAKDACPDGWHVPSLEEWNTLIKNLGGRVEAGGKLKSKSGWSVKSERTTNSSGMSVLPAGNKAVGGSYFHLGEDALIWTSTPKSNLSVWKVRLRNDADSINFQACSRLTGLSVRCIKD